MRDAAEAFSTVKANYLACAFWTEEEELDGKDVSGLSEDAINLVEADVLAFLDKFYDRLIAVAPLSVCQFEQAGHDLWLTRNRHGAGFWDRGNIYGHDLAKAMTEYSHSLKELSLAVGSDGKLYFE